MTQCQHFKADVGILGRPGQDGGVEGPDLAAEVGQGVLEWPVLADAEGVDQAAAGHDVSEDLIHAHELHAVQEGAALNPAAAKILGDL